MAFSKLDGPLEAKLAEILDGYRYGNLVDIRRSPEPDELARLGYVDQVSADCSGNVCLSVPYKGLRYFDQKSEWLARIRELAVAETELSNEDMEVLEVIVGAFVDGNGGPVGPQYPTSDTAKMSSIRKLDRMGYLKVFYADNEPYLVSATIDGMRAICQEEEDAIPTKKPWGHKVASILGTFTGAAAREFNDM